MLKPVDEYILSTYLSEEVIKNSSRSKIESVTSSLNDTLFLKKTFYEDKREVFELLKELDSPSLVHIHEVIFDDESGETIVIEDYIEGETLDKACARGSITQKELKCYFLSLISALEKLHEKNIIHRDVKPENIIITPDNRAVLIDCGIARLYKGERAFDTETLGTRGYAAPEQYGFAPSGPETDIYALGKTIMDVCRECRIKGPVLKTAKKCAMFDPQNRFQSTAEVRRALEAGVFFSSRWFVAALLLLVLAGASYFVLQKREAVLVPALTEKPVTPAVREAEAPSGAFVTGSNPWEIVSKEEGTEFASLLLNSGNGYKKQSASYVEKGVEVTAVAELSGRGKLVLSLSDSKGHKKRFTFALPVSESGSHTDSEVLFMDLDGDGVREIFPVLSQRRVASERGGEPAMFRYSKSELHIIKRSGSGGFTCASDFIKFRAGLSAFTNRGAWSGLVGDPSGFETSFCGSGAGKIYSVDSSGMRPVSFSE